MTTKYNLDNPMISKITEGLEGKAILVYGTNDTGKTKQGARMTKPFYLGFEDGKRAISGLPYLPIRTWSDAVKIIKKLTNPRKIAHYKKMYQTIIFDEVSASAKMCEAYISDQYEVRSISEGKDGFGLWKEYKMEYWKQINKLLNSGYTVYFIAHDTVEEVTYTNPKTGKSAKRKKIFPEGDKRSIFPIRNAVDICIYLSPSDIDENGELIKSSAHFKNTSEFFARSRFDYLPNYIEEYTVENLTKAINDAIAKEKELNPKSTISFQDLKEETKVEKLPLEVLIENIKKIALKLNELEKWPEYTEIVEEYLGTNGSVKNATEKQYQQVDLIYYDLQELLEDLEIDIEDENEE